MKLSILTIAVVLTSLELFSQDTISNTKFFRQRTFGEYFVSDIYAPYANLSIGYWTNSVEYNIDSTRNSANLPLVEMSLGAEIPVGVWSKGDHSLSFSFPFNFQLWLDLFENVTAPVLNTDYRVGAELNYLFQIRRGFIKNLGVKFIPVLHESTHIGDEVTLYRVSNEFPIRRVNVSYEVMEIAFQLNDPMEEIVENLSMKLGARFLLNPGEGWYTATEADADTLKVASSQRWIEPYLQLEYQKPDGFLSTKKIMFLLSGDIRMRIKFGYPYYTYEDNMLIENANSESYFPSVNTLLGWKYKNVDNEVSQLGFYFRFYYGINYHGQFRNHDQFKFMGICVVYEY